MLISFVGGVDELELAAIAHVTQGTDMGVGPWLSSTKGAVGQHDQSRVEVGSDDPSGCAAAGHLLGAAGAVEALFCVAAIRDQVL